MLAPRELWWVDDFELEQSKYSRPGLCLRPTPDGGGIFLPLSTNFDLFENERRHFELPDDEEDFAATGLPRRSYVIRAHFILPPEQLDRRLGALEGTLAQRFDRWLTYGF